MRFETGPGVQARADWGETRQVRFSTGEVLTRYVFTMVLAFSRLRFVLYLPEVTQAWLLWAHTRAFEYFRGRAAHDPLRQPQAAGAAAAAGGALAAALAGLRTALWVCATGLLAGTAPDEGSVENAVGFHERDFLRVWSRPPRMTPTSTHGRSLGATRWS